MAFPQIFYVLLFRLFIFKGRNFLVSWIVTQPFLRQPSCLAEKQAAGRGATEKGAAYDIPDLDSLKQVIDLFGAFRRKLLLKTLKEVENKFVAKLKVYIFFSSIPSVVPHTFVMRLLK